MHKIDTDTAVGNEFVDGNEAASIKATRLNAKWFNTIQRELCNIVEQAGMALSENDDGQVLVALIEYIRKYGIQNILSLLSFTNKSSSLRVGPDRIEFNLSEDPYLTIGFDGIGISGEFSRVEINGTAVRFFSSNGQIIFNSEGVSIADVDGKNRQTIVSKDKDGVFQRVTSESVTSDTISSRIAMIQNLSQASASDMLQVNIPTLFNQGASFNNTVSFSNTVSFGQGATFYGKTSCLGLLDARDGLRLQEYIEGSAPTSAEDGTIIAVMNSDGSKHWLAIRSGGGWKPLNWNYAL